MNAPRKHRRGMAAVLAMLYLVLFSTLAIGFYAATTTAVQVVNNDQRGTVALLDAESGMEYIRYQLAQLDIPHNTPQAQLFSEIYNQLMTQLFGTANMAGKSMGMSSGVISIPSSPSQWLRLDTNGAQFRVTIANLGQKVRVKVVAQHGTAGLQRAVQMDYDLAQNASSIFDFGVASRGKISTSGSSRIKGATDPTKGSVLSTNMTDPTPVSILGKEISGDISITNPNGNVVFAGASVGGTMNAADIVANHIHKGVEAPEFPAIDTDAFKTYATDTYASGKALTNTVIKANTNPKFAGGATINGVVYVETPNKIEFVGNAVINGVIVVQNNPTGDLSSNQLIFSGNVTATGVETLPSSYGNLRQLTGSFVLAPGFHVTFSGDFGTVNGSIVADQVTMSGNAGGTVMGSVLNMQNTEMEVKGSSEIIIASTGTSNYPAGVFFSSRYAPLADTYEEVQP